MCPSRWLAGKHKHVHLMVFKLNIQLSTAQSSVKGCVDLSVNGMRKLEPSTYAKRCTHRHGISISSRSTEYAHRVYNLSNRLLYFFTN